MNHEAPTPGARDRALRRSARLRRTLVGGSAAASLGIAAALGLGALDQSLSATATSSGGSSSSGSSSGTSSGGTSSSGTTDSGSSSTRSTPQLSSGSGSSHASTGGS